MEDHTVSAVRKCLLNTFAITPISGDCSFIRSLKTRQAMGDRGPGNEAFQVTKNMQQDETQQHCAVTCDEILLDCSQTYKYLTRGNQLASA
jgi:hypothetical protein